MEKRRHHTMLLVFLALTAWDPCRILADGGFVSTESVAVSADQRAIIIKNGDLISTTFSTGYSGGGEDFSWIIPSPVPPAIEDVYEIGETAEASFGYLDEISAPRVVIRSRGCFPSGTEVITIDGPKPIESVQPGKKVYGYDFVNRKWVLSVVVNRESYHYTGDVISIGFDDGTIQATRNHPFYVVHGDRLGSRPAAVDVPEKERINTEQGRWVQARDLKDGDILRAKSGETAQVIRISSRNEEIVVYNLNVGMVHNYAVHQRGILVHNKGMVESSESLVTVYGRATLEHYEISVLGAAGGLQLMEWLEENDYHVSQNTEWILDDYVDRGWAFVAVKLNPSEKRRYDNEFLPPLTIQFHYDKLIFPLRISAISTTQEVGIALYVVAESTVSSLNFTSKPLKYNRHALRRGDPEGYVENCIRQTIGKGDRILAVMHKNELWSHEREEISMLINKPFMKTVPYYLTRLETRFDPAALTQDIELTLDRKPQSFRVHSEGSAAAVQARGFALFIVILLLAVIILLFLMKVFLGLPVFGLVMLAQAIKRRSSFARNPRSRSRDDREQSRREGLDSDKAT